METKVKIEVVGLTSGQTQQGSYTLIMGEKDSKVKLPIIIANYEAQTIAFEIPTNIGAGSYTLNVENILYPNSLYSNYVSYTLTA